MTVSAHIMLMQVHGLPKAYTQERAGLMNNVHVSVSSQPQELPSVLYSNTHTPEQYIYTECTIMHELSDSDIGKLFKNVGQLKSLY